MSYGLVFDNTGDVIPFDPVNQDLLDFYIDQLNQQTLNKFSSTNPYLGQTIHNQLESFKSCIQQINEWIYDLADIKFEVHDVENYLDQSVLNQVHAEWAKSHSIVYDIQKKRKQFNFSGLAESIHDMFPDDIQTPLLGVVLAKIGKLNSYNQLNVPHVHNLEESFKKIRYQTGTGWTVIADNIFPRTWATNDIANLSLSFNHLGRTLYNKFVYFDQRLEYDDENSYDELLGFVTLSLQPSQTINYSAEYLSWCNTHNKEPIGDFLNIGNIPNLYENLTKYRKIVFKNLLANNRFAIHKT